MNINSNFNYTVAQLDITVHSGSKCECHSWTCDWLMGQGATDVLDQENLV